jgi:hypothetical protein
MDAPPFSEDGLKMKIEYGLANLGIRGAVRGFHNLQMVM